jgi:hypothetical protein
MPQCRAIKTFRSEKYGLLRSGAIFSSEKGYAQELKKKNMIVILPDPLRPARVQAFPGAPVTQENGAPANPPPANPDMADPTDDGPAKPSASSRRVPASRRKTSSSRERARAPSS